MNQIMKKKSFGLYKKSPGEESLREHSLKAELESGTSLLEGNLRYSIIAEKQNFSNTITVNENNIIVLGQEKVLSAKLFHWEDYLKYAQKQWDWLVCLKIALDIYHGETKGYYGVPYIKEERERKLKHKMMDLIQEGIKSMIKNYNRDGTSRSSDYSADNIAIKASVEFCNRIDEINFLFTGIIKLFIEENLEDKFIENLEPFILSGYFKDKTLPSPVLKKICDHYFNNEKYHCFERIVSKLNFSHYDLFNELETICKEKMLTTALIHLIITSTSRTDKNACLKILNNVFNRFKQASKYNTLDEVKEILLKDEESKYKIETSYEYIGLKLLYIIRLFIKGERFPSGRLNEHQKTLFLSQSIEFLLREDEATELMKLDARTFFNVVSGLYLNSYISEILAQKNNELNDKDEPKIPFTHTKIVDILHERVLSIDKQQYIKFEYSYFVIKIADSDFCKENAKDMSEKIYQSAYNIMQEIIKLNDSPKKNPALEVTNRYKYAGPEGMEIKKIEAEILSVIPYYTPRMDTRELDNLIDSAEQLKLDKLKIHLYEQKQEFGRCIMIYLESDHVKKTDVFQWLFNLSKKKDKKKESKIEDLKVKISNVIEDLVTIDATKTGNIIDEWLPDKQKEVINKLGKTPKLQLQYLESYLEEREEDIIEKFAVSSIQSKSSLEANNYKAYLIKHVELLAKNNDPKLIDVVKKKHYPLGWLDSVAKGSSTLIQEARAHLKKREGMYSESIKIFLDLVKSIDRAKIEEELLTEGQVRNKRGHVLSFSDIFIEIWENLRLHSKENPESDEIWVETLRTLFAMRNNSLTKDPKTDMISQFIYTKIERLMELMSEYVNFEKIIEVLLSIDNDLTYQHAKEWFKSLYVSKNDQELLYTSAKRLLSNENSSLIDTIIERNNAGFIGEREKQICALWNAALGCFVVDCAFILTQCDHQFHSKCFFEEIKNRKLQEGKKDFKPECPICKKNHIEFDDKKSKASKEGRRGRRRNRKKTDSNTNDEEAGDEEEDDISNHPLMDKTTPIRTMDQYEKEYKSMDNAVYKQKLSAFDEDFAASQLNFMID
jgi:hypothetical protein